MNVPGDYNNRPCQELYAWFETFFPTRKYQYHLDCKVTNSCRFITYEVCIKEHDRQETWVIDLVIQLTFTCNTLQVVDSQSNDEIF